tara:strand:- start:4406 stop:6250 length:1845 start_codon:yes stop_codon:yes gene_type:complete
MTNIKRNIKYLNRDFSDFRNRLIEYSKTYFPNTYNDFSPSSPGMLFMEQASYVGDVLSFYLDTQLQENFVQYSKQPNNVFELAYMFGYKPKITGASQASIRLTQQLPTQTAGGITVPDYNYALTIPPNTIITSQNGNSFILKDSIDFSVSSSSDATSLEVASITGNSPSYFNITKYTEAISSTISSETFTFASYSPFQTININSNNILGILDIKDADGNIWYEVDYLGQEMVFDSIKNTNVNDPNTGGDADTPYLLKLKKIQRRFATRFLDKTTLQIQFGAGNPEDTDEEIVPNSNNVGLGLPFEKTKLTTAYSPSNFLYTKTYGISPTDTSLTVRYLTGGGVSSNAASFSLNNIDTSNVSFSTIGLDPTTANFIFSTLSSTNPEASSGGSSGDSLEEIRQNTLMSISAQQRSVTSDDYLIRALSMPPRYGVLAKAFIEKPNLTDNQVSTIETLNLWALSKDSNGKLSLATSALKQNLRTYLSQNRIIGDNIEIRDAFIINISVSFEVIVLPNYNNNEVLIKGINSLKEYFVIDNWQINQPILIRDLYILLDKIEGVQTVKNLIINNKSSGAYSVYAYDIEGATQNNVIYPSLDPSIFEVKYPNQDIKGKVVPL